MKLTKVDAGWFKGAKGADVTLVLVPRDGGKLKVISAAYDDQLIPKNADGSIDIKLKTGKKAFTVGYAATVQGQPLDLCEKDGGETHKLRFTTFDPAWPTVMVFLEGK